MRSWIKRLMASLIITVTLIVAINYIGKFLNPDWSDGALNAIDAFHCIPEDSLDVIIYGSSHAWKGVDSVEMYEKYGIEAYNYGCNWQHINTTSLFLQDSLRTQSPKVVFIETFHAANVLMDTDLNGEIYYTRAIRNFDGKKEYLKQCFGDKIDRYLAYYMPLVMFHSTWNEIDQENFDSGVPINAYIKNRGYEASPVVTPANIGDYKDFNQYELNDECIKILDNIVNICKKRNIEIVFFTVPYQGEFNYIEAMETYALDNDCTYLNLFSYIEEMGLDGETDFRDETHLNDSGARKVGDFLGRYIVENYKINVK